MAPADWRTLRDRIRENRKNTTFLELKEVLETAGFTMHPRNQGSHRAFSRPGCFRSPSIPGVRGPMKVAYVREVLRALEECCDE